MDLGDLAHGDGQGNASERHDIVMKLASEATEGMPLHIAVRKESCIMLRIEYRQCTGSQWWSMLVTPCVTDCSATGKQVLSSMLTTMHVRLCVNAKWVQHKSKLGGHWRD